MPEKSTLAEFVPALCYGDGKPWDVGTDRAIAKTLNAFVDYKSAHQGPALCDELFCFDPVATTWEVLKFYPMFMGLDHVSSTITRSLVVAPWFRSSIAGQLAEVRVVISRSPPVSARVGTYLPGQPLLGSVYNDHFASSEWSTTSDVASQGADASLSLNVKDIHFGFVWVLIEGRGRVRTRGLSKCVEGPRVVT